MAKSYFEQLKEAIQKRDWNKVQKAYENITGDKIAVSIQEIDDDEDDGGVTRTGANLSNRIGDNHNSKKMPIKIAKVNLFKDDGVEVERDDTSYLKKVKKTKPRAKAETVVVRCVKCGDKAFMEKSSLGLSYNGEKDIEVKDDYYCGDCISKKGR